MCNTDFRDLLEGALLPAQPVALECPWCVYAFLESQALGLQVCGTSRTRYCVVKALSPEW